MKSTSKYLTSKQWIVGLFRKLAVLQVVAYVANCICMLVDSAVTGIFLGPDLMASFGLVVPLSTICFAFALIAGCGTNILCINESVSGDKDRVRNRFVLSVLASLAIAAVLAVLLFFFSDSILAFISGKNADAELSGPAADYLRVYGLGIPAMVLNMIFMSTFQMDGEKALLVISTVLLTVADIVLDILAAMVFKNGLKGMAIATVCSNYIQTLVLLLHFCKHGKLFKFKLKRPEWKSAFAFFAKGYPMGLQLALMAAMTVFANSILLNQFGADAVSVMAVIFSCGAILRVAGDAAGSAMVPVATLCDSEKNRLMLKDGFAFAVKWIIVVCGVLSIVEFFLAEPIARLYFEDTPLKDTAVIALRCFALSIGLYGICYLVQSTYLAVGEMMTSCFCSLLSDFTVPLICIIIQSRFGLTGFWLTFITGKAVTLLLYICYAAGKRNKNEKAGFGDLVVIPASKYNIVETLSCEIRTAEDVTGASEQIRAKMREHGTTIRLANALSLAVEEIASYVISYGIKKKKKVYVNVYMNYDGTTWTARIRDNGSTRNPLECLVVDDSVDEFAKIGIRMVSKMVKDTKYIRTVETNNIVMKVSE